MSAKKKPKDQVKSGKAASQTSKITARQRRIAVIAFAFSGTAALMYEVLWTRELSLVFGSTVYAVSMMLAAFMSGLSLGAFLGGKWADKSEDLIVLFGKLEIGIAVFGLLSLPLVQVMPTIYFYVYDAIRPAFWVFFLFQMMLSFFIMLIPTTFMGATFPVVTKINTPALDELGTDVGNVYSINTLGSIAGSLATGFLLIPLIGVKSTTFVAAAFNIAVAGLMFWNARRLPKLPFVGVGAGSLVLVAALTLSTSDVAFAHGFYRIGDFEDYAAYEAYRDQVVTEFFADDVHGRVVVFSDNQSRYLQNSGKVEGSTDELDKQTTALLAWLPIAAVEDPKSALVVGLGTGYTTERALESDLERVDTVEINHAVLEASRLFVEDRVESNPRSEIFVTDARNYLETSDRTYDVITSEPSYPLSTHVSHLFTLEFYELAKERLNEDGVLCQWIPRYLLRDEDTEMMLKTFQQVFPQVYVWGSNQGQNEAVDMLLIGVNGDRILDPTEINAAVVENVPDVQLDFGFFADPETVAAVVDRSDEPLNTDDLPHLEFRAPRNQIEFYREGLEGLAQ